VALEAAVPISEPDRIAGARDLIFRKDSLEVRHIGSPSWTRTLAEYNAGEDALVNAIFRRRWRVGGMHDRTRRRGRPGSRQLGHCVDGIGAGPIRGARVALAPVASSILGRQVRGTSTAPRTAVSSFAPIAGADRYGITATAPGHGGSWVADVRRTPDATSNSLAAAAPSCR